AARGILRRCCSDPKGILNHSLMVGHFLGQYPTVLSSREARNCVKEMSWFFTRTESLKHTTMQRRSLDSIVLRRSFGHRAAEMLMQFCFQCSAPFRIS